MLSLLLGILIGWSILFVISASLFRYFIKDDIKTRNKYLTEMAELNADYYN
ncbi:MAG: hypothetical protein JEY94_11155 [Melioribacteraceae bacterium]|nr:hypothetical protein [Melioribacteraceae bacterium]